MYLLICIWLPTSISKCMVHHSRRLFGWTLVSPLLLSHSYRKTHTSFIRLPIHSIARVLLLLNCRLVVPFCSYFTFSYSLYALVLALTSVQAESFLLGYFSLFLPDINFSYCLSVSVTLSLWLRCGRFFILFMFLLFSYHSP